MAKLVLDYYRGTDRYSDGDVEEKILNTIMSGKTLDDMEPDDISYAELYHLSPARENILNWYDFKENASVIEVGAGCGAITGVLCRNNAHVLSVELSKRRASINYERHKDAENLEIWVGNLNDMTISKKFDYAVLNGVLEYAAIFTEGDNPYETFINHIAGYLKEDGVLLIAIENRLGLKYFAGAREDHVNSFFAGLNEYRGIADVRTFSKSELSDVLKNCGFLNNKFYYPYPDYKFPEVIYTDESINTGLSWDYRDYQGNRALLFNEAAVANSLAKEGVANVFANSFLVECCREDINRKRETEFAKINSDRAEQFRISTVIKRDGHGKNVVKSPLSDAAREHVRNICINSAKLCSDTVSYNNAKMHEDSVVFDYIEGRTMLEMFSDIVRKKDKNAILEYIDNYCDKLVMPGSVETEYGGAQFAEVFGDETVARDICLCPANVDLILNNVFVTDKGFSIIDAEWVMNFPVPVKFIIWRTVNEIYTQDARVEDIVNMQSVRERYGISDADDAKYQQWNRYFTLVYIGANRMDAYAKEKAAISMDTVYAELFGKNVVSRFYIDYGRGFNENDVVTVNIGDGDFSINLELQKLDTIKDIRWDPEEGRECRCYLEIGRNGKWERAKRSNCKSKSDSEDVFQTRDPYYYLGTQSICNGRIKLRGHIEFDD